MVDFSEHHLPGPRPPFVRQLLGFAWIQTRACAFAIALLSGVAASALLPGLPVARYDLLLVYGVLLTLLFWARGWETGRDLAVIAVCHAIGLAFEWVKVSLGSWSYPEPAVLKFAGVPLYGGFLYAAVGSYVCRAWHLFDLGLERYRPRPTAVVAAAVYLNFFTHHWLPDARWPLAAALLAVTAGTWVHFTVRGVRRWMPLALSFVLIGFFLWVAENLATYAGAWRYPNQLNGWQPVALHKFGAWALLISITFVLAQAARTKAGALKPDRPRS
ncbi:DUF817 domain-containing protein [Streptomyces sp. TRM66268-LWL]|uniref:DUF817 domain-containing protein n=1 Tax=Streptomyces polyasparticus TaxID=2767826 RepID=A0ABR7SR95_9ACTN|nr:DUF817 domain-containing protein [Streptomyces polyasparticus]MBC9717041.1 DUF817 domain-containing protein [Streptomyces polyasparticus]